MNSFASKVIALVLSVLMLAYVGYQAYLSFYDPYETEVVQKEQYLQTVPLDGYFVRDELVVEEKKEGVIGYNYKNAEKIPKNAVLANIYESESDLYYLKKVETLTEEKKILEEAQNRDSSEGLKLDLLASQISDNEMSLVQCVDNNDFSSLNSTYRNLMLNLNKFNIHVNKITSFSEAIASVELQIATLQSQISQVKDTVKVSESGYFSNVVDGFESRFTTDSLADLTLNEIQSNLTVERGQPLDNIGKIIRNNTWYFVSMIQSKEASLFAEGTTITLKFSSESTREVPAVVERVITEPDSDFAAVVFSSDYLDENFVTMRFEKPTAVVKNYTGIVIPKEAIRIRSTTDEEGNPVDQKVVYILVGKSVYARQVNPVYEDEYVVISKIMNSSDYVGIYDQVILKGKGLDEAAK